MAKCGWCMTNDHGAHLYGGTTWRCDCGQCARKGPGSPRAVQTYVRTSESSEESAPPGLSRPQVPTATSRVADHGQGEAQDAPVAAETPAAPSAPDATSGDDFDPFAEDDDGDW